MKLINSCDSNKSSSNLGNNSFLNRPDWEPSVKDNLNTLIKNHKNNNEYVVFDFDNTCSIFDLEEMVCIYQIETMSFEIAPNELKEILLTTLDKNSFINGFGFFENDNAKITYDDLTDDIAKAYAFLYQKYGPFSANGLDENKQKQLHKEEEYKEFSTKLRMMYDLVCLKETLPVAYPWVIYWFKGMSEKQVYSLAYKCHEKYSKVNSKEITLVTEGTNSKTGKVSFSYIEGIQVTENIKELFKAFANNGIDVWVCSASHLDVIRAGIDYFGLHDYCKGLIALTNKIDSNLKLQNEYDYEKGCASLAIKNGKWEKGKHPTQVQIQREGKVISIKNSIFPYYGNNKGPIAGFMDSTGDFNFCTEFKSLELVVCFNRATRKVTDGGGLIAAISMYQTEYLKWDYNKAKNSGDTLYLLQGRDENGLRTLRPSKKSVLFDKKEESLFKNEDNMKLYNYICKNKLSIETAINTFAIKTSVPNELDCKYGFLDEYSGYHSI